VRRIPVKYVIRPRGIFNIHPRSAARFRIFCELDQGSPEFWKIKVFEHWRCKSAGMIPLSTTVISRRTGCNMELESAASALFRRMFHQEFWVGVVYAFILHAGLTTGRSCILYIAWSEEPVHVVLSTRLHRREACSCLWASR